MTNVGSVHASHSPTSSTPAGMPSPRPPAVQGRMGEHVVQPGAGDSQLSALRMRPDLPWDFRPVPRAIDPQAIAAAVAAGDRYAPERSFSPKHVGDTVGRGAQHYMLSFGVANILTTASAMLGFAWGGPIAQMAAGSLTVPSEAGLAKGRIGGIPNQNPGGPVKRFLMDKATDEPALWAGFVGMYALQEHVDAAVLDLDPSAGPWQAMAVLGVKLIAGMGAGIITAVGTQYLREKIGGAQIKAVPVEARKTAYFEAWKAMFQGNLLLNKQLLMFLGRGLCLLPFGIGLKIGLFDGKSWNPEILGHRLFTGEHGAQHATVATIGLLLPYMFRNDLGNVLIRAGAKLNELLGRSRRPDGDAEADAAQSAPAEVRDAGGTGAPKAAALFHPPLPALPVLRPAVPSGAA